jgi:hypothetical protein
MYTPSLREDRPDMLLGRPIIYTEYCKTIGTQGDLILANWNEYLEGTYQPMQNDGVHPRPVRQPRADLQVLDAERRSAVVEGRHHPGLLDSSKLSPFIVLDTRS